MSTKTNKVKKVKFTKEAVSDLSKNKPAQYNLLNRNNKIVYAGSTKRGEIINRLKTHLKDAKFKNVSNVRINEKSSIREAQKLEQKIIKREKPKFNKKGKN